MVFLNDRGIGKYVAREDWVPKKDWPINVDKKKQEQKVRHRQETEEALPCGSRFIRYAAAPARR